MPIIAGSLALNIILGIAVWFSGVSVTAKSLATVLLIGKNLLFLCSQWMGMERLRKIGVLICTALNAALAVYGAGIGEYTVAVFALLLLISLLTWSFATVFDLPARKSNQR